MTQEKKPGLKGEMTNGEILKKAIEKVLVQGFLIDFGLWNLDEFCCNYTSSLAYYQIIFSHDFAKAFWGEKGDGAEPYEFVSWRYHIQQMVLDPEPLQYLAKFL